MKRISINSVQPGDILFTARPGKISKSIRFSTGGIVSHAMICVQHGSFIDSTADGVQARNLQRELFEDDEQVFHFRLKEALPREVLSNVIDFARAEIGARYSVPEAMRSVAAVRKPRSKRQYCSRLVARVYRNAGIDLVPDADYCSPEDLRRSHLLVEIPIETEAVPEEEWLWLETNRNPIRDTHLAHKAILDVARTFVPDLESLNELHALLVTHPESDPEIAKVLRESGYLDLWRGEIAAHPWRYDQSLIAAMSAPEQMADIREYCIGTVSEAYSGGVRFSISLIQLQMLENQHGGQSFRMLVDLYETLVLNDQIRREVAFAWLLKHYPEDLKKHLEQIEPHSAYWYSIVDRVEPKLAVLSRMVVTAEDSPEVCSSCGDRPAMSYRLANGAQTMPGVPSLRLCCDCIEIRRGMGNVLMPFLP
ncbi:YiiX/YebB-like N1pC/P60 family cysteine hydrolase [Rhizobium etli]|uniref:YiiX/YebB-like N1pC/P60 family cysteine hydrolase n=1 Tax=Rhizobium etli TaxID=29449 RepID=UPI0003839029|nr:YiiX/YebB-like N1pC/P60 family cysteine hydrolase [Rhizobium etli]AGS24384.1 hypothetical protein REMIM1_PC00028 [Rhizobium etli bv. mimosae str. Mim1]